MTRATPPLPDPPLVAPGHDLASVTRGIAAVPLQPRAPWLWWGLFLPALALLGLLQVSIFMLAYVGVGIWGINIPVAWGFAITNFVWWIGIGHAGTLISAVLLLLRQGWRTSTNRLAEAMTLFAVMCAGLFPILHLGRMWKFYYLLPYYPNTLGIWPQWRSPLVWDVFAVTTYLTISLVFWYIGLIPDLATLRDRARHPLQRFLYGVFALGWRHSARHWHRHQMAYLLLAGLATPLVISVHSVVSFDFAVSIVPGWHTTVFPPYFVAGAIFSGFAMVLTLVIPLRAAVPRFRDFITARHLDLMARLTLTTGLVVAYGYLMEHFMSWAGSNRYDQYITHNRMVGAYAWAYWLLIACNVGVPQLLWFRRIRVSPVALFIIAILINYGMWIERYVIIITSLHRDYLPSAWGMFAGTFWDYAVLAGSFGLFLTGMLLFLRYLPAISISEMRELVDEHPTAPGPAIGGRPA